MSDYSKKIEDLKKGGDFLGLTKELKNPPSFDTTGVVDESVRQEIQEDEQAYKQAYEEGIEFLRDNIHHLVELFQSNDNRKKFQVLDAFELAQDDSTIQILIDAALKDNDQDVKNRAKYILKQRRHNAQKDEDDFWIENSDTNKLLLDKLKENRGEDLKTICDIIASCKDKYNELHRSAIDSLSEKKCSIIGGRCNKTIMKEDKYFIGFKFNRKVEKAVNKAVEFFESKCPSLKAEKADNRIIDAHILCNICMMIQSSRFSVFVLTPDSLLGKNPNPNVISELGIAYGCGIPVLLLLKKGTAITSDIQGKLRIEYKSLVDLVEKLRITNLDGIYKVNHF